MKLRIHFDARREFEQATAYYRKINKELARRFVFEVEDAFERVVKAPKQYPVHTGDARAKILKRFPYTIVYLLEADELHIVAVMHHKRRPGYWLQRTFE